MALPSTAAAHDWRPIMKRRIAVVAALLGAVGGRHRGQARLPAGVRSRRPRARAERQQERTPPSPAGAATSSIAAGVCWRRASTPTRSTPSRRKSDDPADAARKICDALGDCDTKDRQSIAERLGQKRAFAYVAAAGGAGSSRARGRAEPGRHRLHQGEQALLPEQGARRASARLGRRRQQGPRAASSTPTTRRSAARPGRSSFTRTPATRRSADPSGRRRPARASS